MLDDEMSRRRFLQTAATAGVSIAGCIQGDNGGDKEPENSNNEDPVFPDPMEFYSIDSSVQAEAVKEIHDDDNVLEITEEELPVNAEEFFRKKDDHKKARLERFLSDRRIPQDFKNVQLEIALDLEDIYSNVSIEDITNNELLYSDDWSRDGDPHISYDELSDTWEKGESAEDPLSISAGHNTIPRYWFNRSAQVRNPSTGEYLGFQPERGDAVGFRGDEKGHGKIVPQINQHPKLEFVEDLEDGDLNPDKIHTFLLVNYEKPPDDYHKENLFPEEALAELEDLFKTVPSESFDRVSNFYDGDEVLKDITYDEDIENNRTNKMNLGPYNSPWNPLFHLDFPNSNQVSEIKLHPINGFEFSNEGKIQPIEAHYRGQQKVPENLSESMEHLYIANNLENLDGYGTGAVEEMRNYGVVDKSGARDPLSKADLIAHEVYGHGLGRIRGHPFPKNGLEETKEGIMDYSRGESEEFRFLPEHWTRILARNPTVNEWAHFADYPGYQDLEI